MSMNATISFDKLWQLLADRNMKVKDLQSKAKISSTILAKMRNGQIIKGERKTDENHVSTKTLLNICKFLDCDICDIVEIKK